MPEDCFCSSKGLVFACVVGHKCLWWVTLPLLLMLSVFQLAAIYSPRAAKTQLLARRCR